MSGGPPYATPIHGPIRTPAATESELADEVWRELDVVARGARARVYARVALQEAGHPLDAGGRYYRDVCAELWLARVLADAVRGINERVAGVEILQAWGALMDRLCTPEQAGVYRAALAEDEVDAIQRPEPLRAATRWACWRPVIAPLCNADEPPTTLCEPIHWLATDLWFSTVEPARRGRTAHRMPGLTRRVVDGILVPHMSRRVRSGVSGLGTTAGHSLVRMLVQHAHAAWEAGDPDPRRIVIEGGWTGLADVVGLGRQHKAISALRAIADAASSVTWTESAIDNTAQRLWTYETTASALGRPARLVFKLGDALLPEYSATLAAGSNATARSSREGRLIVPELRLVPPVSGAGRPADAGAVLTACRAVVSEMTLRSTEVPEHGGVHLPRERLRELLVGVGAATGRVGQIVDAWLAGDDKAPALLHCVARDRYVLGEAHAPEAEFMRAAGERRLESSRRGTRSARIRRERAARQAAPPSSANASAARTPRIPHWGRGFR